VQRTVSILVILGAAGFFLHRHWDSVRPKVDPIVQPVISAVTGEPAPHGPEILPGPTPLPRTGLVAPPGFLYMLERVSQTTDTGVVAVIPGEQVRIMQRKPNGRLRITTGRHDFEVKESQVTQDFDLAQTARVRAGIPPQ
jgi:hypothetical protein